MKYFNSIVFLLLFSSSFILESNEFTSIGQPSISFDIKKNLVYQGDAISEINTCAETGLEYCIIFDGNIITVTENLLSETPKPSRVKVNEHLEILSLPVLQNIKVLGKTFEGYIITVNDSIHDKNTIIFYTKNEGVISFSLNGISYWASSNCGLFAPYSCKQ